MAVSSATQKKRKLNASSESAKACQQSSSDSSSLTSSQTNKKKKKNTSKQTPEEIQAAQEAFRRHFEAQFAPLFSDADEVRKTTSAKRVRQQERERQLKRQAEAQKQRQRQRRPHDDDEDEEEDEEDEDDESLSSDEELLSDSELNDSEGEGDEEWDGVSESASEDDDSADQSAIEVVDYSGSNPSAVVPTTMTKKELRKFMSSRPRALIEEEGASTQTAKTKKSETPGDEDSVEYLKKDLELQRLIAESHILHENATHTMSLNHDTMADDTQPDAKNNKGFVDGKVRRYTTDLRIQNLAQAATTAGSKVSAISVVTKGGVGVQRLAKMPMYLRKRVVANEKRAEEQRRRDAQESGIVLERKNAAARFGFGLTKEKQKRKKLADRRRQRLDITRPGVGRVTNGADIHLSKHDIATIEASGSRGGSGGKGRRGKVGGKGW